MYVIQNSTLIQIIWKPIYLTYLWDTNKYRHTVLYTDNTTTRVHIQIYTHMRKHNQLIMTTSIMNDYTLQKYKSLTLYFRKGDVCCVWETSGWQGRTTILTQTLLLTIAALLPHPFGFVQSKATGGQKTSVCKLVLASAFLSQLFSTRPCTCFNYFLMPTCFHCSSAYLHRCISWLTAQSRVNI